MRALILCVFVCLFVPLFALKKEDFKKCSDSPFCVRHRNAESKQQFQVDVHSFNVQENVLSGAFTSGEAPFLFELSSYRDGNIVRLRITEKAPLKGPRYEVQDVLMPMERSSFSPSLTHLGDGTARVAAGSTLVELDTSTLSFHISHNGVPAFHINSRGLLRFEARRLPGEGESFEERFKSWTDSCPHGPQSVGLDVSFVGTNHVYGIPERASPFSLPPTRGTGASDSAEPYRLYNLDVCEYETQNPFGLYASIPVLVSQSPSRSLAMLWLNSAETYIDVSKQGGDVETHWFSESGIIDVFFLLGSKPTDTFANYAYLTGTSAMPPRFAIAYHQCRWNYKDEADVAEVDAKFDEHDLPLDVLWLDIEHTDGKKYFTWDTAKFPTPARMQKELASKGRKTVTIVDPHIKRDDGYYVHKDATSEGVYVKNKDNADFDGWCWPGSSSWIDFTKPAGRDFWVKKFAPSEYKGSTEFLYTWIDMNEPSVFNGPEITMPKDNLHRDGQVEHRDIHNMFGFYQSMATVAAHKMMRGPNARSFVLTRSAFAGSQRFAALWTGDNTAEWSHLAMAAPMLLALNIAGLSFVGADVGGFFKNPDTELLTRWYQAGAFYPFFRGHAHIETMRREPYLFGEAVTANVRGSLRLRYSLLPYWYTVFREAYLTGNPIMRPLFVEFPHDESLYGVDDTYMIGASLLVKPVTAPGVTSLQIQLPGTENWYDLHTGAAVAAGLREAAAPSDRIPVFIRAGSVIARQERPRRDTWAMLLDPYTLTVALDSHGRASGLLYLDDGSTHDHENGMYALRAFNMSESRLSSAPATNGAFGTTHSLSKPASELFVPPANVFERIVILGLTKPPHYATLLLNGHTTRLDIQSVGDRLIVRNPRIPIGADWTITLHNI